MSWKKFYAIEKSYVNIQISLKCIIGIAIQYLNSNKKYPLFCLYVYNWVKIEYKNDGYSLEELYPEIVTWWFMTINHHLMQPNMYLADMSNFNSVVLPACSTHKKNRETSNPIFKYVLYMKLVFFFHFRCCS